LLRLGRIAIASLLVVATAAVPAMAHEFKPPWGYASIDDKPFHDPAKPAVLLPRTQVHPRGFIRDVGPPDGLDVRLTALVFKPNSSTPLRSCVAVEGDFKDVPFGCPIDIKPDEVAFVRYVFCRFVPPNGGDQDCLPHHDIARPTPTPTPTATPIRTSVPTPPPQPIDRDGDGHSPPADCSDVNATVHPGAPEIAGNLLDDDCVGGDALARLPALIEYKFKTVNGRTRTLKLRVYDAPPGTRIDITCAGKRCPFKSRSTTTDADGDALLRKLFRKRLRARLTIEIRATYPNSIGKVWRFRTRGGDNTPSLTRRCLLPDAPRPTAC
jgi:hypothetical protein